MKELMDKYREMFDEQFPLMLFMGADEEIIIETLQKCIENEEPYEQDFEDGVVY